MEIIKIENFTKMYGSKVATSNVNLCVNEKDFFGFIGPNGAGKSTTIRAILGLLKPTKGHISVLGYDSWNDKHKFLREVGYLPSEVSFDRGMKVKEVIDYSIKLRCLDCYEEAYSLCNEFDLDINRKVEELSFGNKKKVAIVLALCHNPKLIILDEPTSGLDPLMQKKFMNILTEKNKKGSTIFLSSHILSEIEHYCSKAAIIKEGKIISCDDVKNLIKSSYKKVSIKGDINIDDLPNVKNVEKSEDMISFIYSGDINLLIKKLSTSNIKDFTASEPELEEIFMHYYEEDK